MKAVTALAGLLFLLIACAPAPISHLQKTHQITCRTHARTATFHGPADEQAHYLDCMNILGRHDIEVTDAELP